jgi:membrane protease YdiL (CAAX protease family)
VSTTSTDSTDPGPDSRPSPPAPSVPRVVSGRRAAVVVVAGLFAFTAAIVASITAARVVHGAAADLARTATAFVVELVLLGAIVRFARLDAKSIGLGLERRDAARFGAGVLLGVVAIVATVSVIAVASGVHVAIAPRAQWPLVRSFALQLFATAFGAAFEEVAFRAALVGVLALAVRREIAIAIPAVLFGLAHAGNHGATVYSIANTAIAALVLEALFLLPTRDGRPPSLAASTGFHLVWNFAVAAVLGLVVSGGGTSSHFVDVSIAAGVWSGGAYGIEASPATTVTYGLGAAVALAMVFRGRARDGRISRGPDASPE